MLDTCEIVPGDNVANRRNYKDVVLEKENAKLQNTHRRVHTIACPIKSSVSARQTCNQNGDDVFKVFQLSESHLQYLLSSSGNCFVIKPPSDHQHSMAFSKTTSFTLRAGESSNAMLFVSNLDPPISSQSKSAKPGVLGVDNNNKEGEDECCDKLHCFAIVDCCARVYYEITEGRPRLNSALVLLHNPKPKKSSEAEKNSWSEGGSMECAKSNHQCRESPYSFDELCRVVEASERELEDYLRRRMLVINLEQSRNDGSKLRFITDAYFTNVAMLILKRLEEESYDSFRVPKNECIGCLAAIEPIDIIEFVFHNLFDEIESIEDQNPSLTSSQTMDTCPPNNESYFKLNEKVTSRVFAYYVLSNFNKMESTQFEQIMNESLPNGVRWCDDYVSDCVVTVTEDGTFLQRNKKPISYVKYFPEWELTDESVEKRLEQLWQCKSKWTLQQLSPYVLPLLAYNTQELSSVLSKHSKCSIDSSTKLKTFTKRY